MELIKKAITESAGIILTIYLHTRLVLSACVESDTCTESEYAGESKQFKLEQIFHQLAGANIIGKRNWRLDNGYTRVVLQESLGAHWHTHRGTPNLTIVFPRGVFIF